MAKEAPLYDLVLLLAADTEESTRTKILSDVESAITGAGGSIERGDDWGRRPLAFEIRHLQEAEYHLLQFRAPGSLIEELSHMLHITDGVLRFRVIKVRPGTPDAPSSIPVVATASSAHSGAGPSGAHPGVASGAQPGVAASAAPAAPAGAEAPAGAAAGAEPRAGAAASAAAPAES